ncbi:MAG: type IV toxin-antitoxin system AbiEi family antitoxin domain-containing protein [Raoultibacter sp.]
MIEIAFDIERLRDIALDQYGYVTTAQAIGAGVSKQSLSMLTKRTRIERVTHGVYRIPQVAPTRYDRFMLALLWTGVPEAALSHETALDAYDVCDVNPTAIHITVNSTRRIRRKGGSGYVLHRQDLAKSQIAWWEEMRCVKLPVAIEQCIENGTPTYLISQAIENGRKRGLLTKDDETRLIRMMRERNGEEN